MGNTPTSVEFWFDPICPWCWMTSRWASEVASVRGFDIAWHPISLRIINENNPDDSHHEHHVRGHRFGRVVEAARREVGESVVGPLYTAIGTRVHPGEREDVEAIVAESLEEVGIVGEAAQRIAAETDLETSDAQLRANTAHALEIAGPDVGVPIISIDGVAFFGPVVTPAPTGDAALRLWDGIYAAASVPGFYELKRGRTAGPQF